MTMVTLPTNEIIVLWELSGFPRLSRATIRQFATQLNVKEAVVQGTLTAYRRRGSYSYTQAHQLITNFMCISGIRRFCVERCGGKCCHPDGQEVCHDPCIQTGVRRLCCTIFVCPSLCVKIFADRGEGLNTLVQDCGTVVAAFHLPLDISLFYLPYPPAVEQRARFDKEVIDSAVRQLRAKLQLTPAQIYAIDPAEIRIY